MNKQETDEKGKIILPAKLQQEMMTFFRKTSIPKIARAKREQQTRFSNNEEKER